MRAPRVRWREGRPPAAARTARASDATRSRAEQLGMRLQVLPGGLRVVGWQRSANDRVFQRRLDALDPRSGGTAGAPHQFLAGERRADGRDRMGIDAPDACLEIVDLLDVGVMAG